MRTASAQKDEVWVAEDNADVRLLLARAFTRMQSCLHLVFFEDGGELVNHVRTRHTRPRLLLLDLQMPVMNGLETLRAIQAEGCCGGAPVIIFSSLEKPDIIASAYCYGAKLYLKKPYSLDGYSDVAKLCATSAETIRGLSPSAIPVGALDVKRVLQLLDETRPQPSETAE